MPTKKENSTSLKLYNEAVNSAELVDVKLISSSFKVEKEFFSEEGENSKFGFGPKTSKAGFDEEKNMVLGHIEFETSAKLGNKFIMRLQSTYFVAFSFEKKVDKDQAVKFFHRVGKFTSYPYFRNLFAQHVSEAQLELPPLPILKQRHTFKDQS